MPARRDDEWGAAAHDREAVDGEDAGEEQRARLNDARRAALPDGDFIACQRVAESNLLAWNGSRDDVEAERTCCGGLEKSALNVRQAAILSSKVRGSERVAWRVGHAIGIVGVVDELVDEPRHEKRMELVGVLVVLGHAVPQEELVECGAEQRRSTFVEAQLQQIGNQTAFGGAHLSPEKIRLLVRL